MDLLPNHVILKLIPQVRRGQGWVETARCYTQLLEQNLRVRPTGRMPEETFCYNVVIATIDFLVLAFEPYGKQAEPPHEMKTELWALVTRLASKSFFRIVKKLHQAYMLQNRNTAIAKVFEVCCKYYKSSSLTQKESKVQEKSCHALAKTLRLRSSKEKLEITFLEDRLGFSKIHRDVYEALWRRQGGGEEHAMRMSDLQKGDAFCLSYDGSVTTWWRQKRGEHLIRNAKVLDVFGWTPLHYASFLQRKELLSLYFDPALVKQHLDLDKVIGSFGRSPVHMVAISGSQAAMEWVLDCLDTMGNKRNAFERVGTDGMSPVHLATKSGNDNLIEQIISKKIMGEFAGLDIWGRTAIHLAAIYGRVHITSLLLREGAQIDTVDDIGRTPLQYLLEDDSDLSDADYEADEQHASIDALCDEEYDTNEQDHASVIPRGTHEMNSKIAIPDRRGLAKERLEIFEKYASERPENRDEKGRTLLHYAVKYTDLVTIKELLRKGYDENSKDKAELTPLHIALSSKRPMIALALLEGFPDISIPAVNPSIKDLKGQTPLMFAASYGHIDVVKYLVEYYYPKPEHREQGHPVQNMHSKNWIKGVHPVPELSDLAYGPLAKNLDGRTALHLAIRHRETEVSKFLLKSEIPMQEDPNDFDCRILLMEACNNSSREICSLILAKWPGIINEPDPIYGRTPLSWACGAGFEPIVNLLLEHDSVDVNKAARYKDHVDTPLHIAVQNCRYPIVQKLLSHKSIRIETKYPYFNEAMLMAFHNKDFKIIHALFKHPQIGFQLGCRSMVWICRHGNDDLKDIVLEVLENIGNAKASEDLLLELIDITENQRSGVLFTAFVSTAFRGNAWKRMAYPYHKAARISSEESEILLKNHPERLQDVDDDGWSCMDYAETYCTGDLTEPWKGNTFQDPSNALHPRYRRPGLLQILKHNESVRIIPCDQPDHNECFGNTAVQITKSHPDIIRACIRTVHCVPPICATEKYFYFEVTIQKYSSPSEFAIGFCNKGYQEGILPGTRLLSWAYKGDLNALLIGTHTYKWSKPLYTFIDRHADQGKFGAGDTIGAGLNLKTGKGFVTLNGTMMDVGNAFKAQRFNGRKMYPCVGFPVAESAIGLSFSINFSGTDDHPFMYKGQYPEDEPSPGETDHDCMNYTVWPG
ncbi:ankyrin [Pyrenochaeta sp. DS3sAY3a]|nr:ankyrin [Pyrenochaeta sp. DS3sAY3a]